jgi:type IV pilus assembly protein PilY1
MLHAIETDNGIERWAYIPSNLLGKLQNDRTDPNAEPDFAAVDGSPTAKDIYWDHDGDGDREWRTILVSAQGFGGNSIFALDVTDPADWQVLWEATDNPNIPLIDGVAPGGGMGYSFRAVLDKVKVPKLDGNGDPIAGEYEVKWMVYVATSFANIAEQHGGINVFAFDLKTGTEQWTFSSTYADSVNDIPGAVTTYDIDDDTLADRIFVGDMNGRMWELALTNDPAGKWAAGQSVHIYDGPDDPDKDLVKGMAIPLFNAGIGNPISVSPAIILRNGHVLLIFGTGGTDWASNDKGYHVYAVDATEAANLIKSDKQANYEDLGGAIGAKWSLPLAVGEKVWSSPTISAGQIWIVTSFGSMESADPKSDKGGSSKLRLLKLDTGENVWDEPLTIGKVRGSIYVSRKHVYMTTFDGEIIQLGGEDFTAGTGNRVVLKSWQDQ